MLNLLRRRRKYRKGWFLQTPLLCRIILNHKKQSNHKKKYLDQWWRRKGHKLLTHTSEGKRKRKVQNPRCQNKQDLKIVLILQKEEIKEWRILNFIVLDIQYILSLKESKMPINNYKKCNPSFSKNL